MNPFKAFTALSITFILLLNASACFSVNEVSAGAGYSPWDAPLRSGGKAPQRQDDYYVKAIAGHFNHDAKELMKLWQRGFGRNELIKLLVISSKASVPLKDVVKLRDQNTRLSVICARNKVSYEEALSDAAEARKEIDSKTALMKIYDSGTILKKSSGTLTIFYSSDTAPSPIVQPDGTAK